MSKSYDLSTSSKWANLADGEHVIKLKSKGSGYGTSSFSNSVTVTKGVAMPVKGDLIAIESKQYRVLKVNGSVAEVLAMYDASTSQTFGANNTYAGSSLDTYCNSTFYGTLSSSMKTAIVDKTFTQDSWNNTFSETASSHYTGKDSYDRTYYLILVNENFGAQITRHCYCLSVQDVLNYLDCAMSMDSSNTTLTNKNVLMMVWNQSTTLSQNIWLRSANSSGSSDAFNIYGSAGSLSGNSVSNGLIRVRPAFQIDLSKIEWTKR